MPNTEKDFQLILAEKLVDDMNRFMKESKADIPKEFSDLAKPYKKDGKVTFKDQSALKEFSDKLLDVSFPNDDKGVIMLQSAGVIKNLADNNTSQLESTLNRLTTQIKSQSPQFYNKTNLSPTAPPTSEKALKEWKQKMAVRTGFSKMFHEHLKHLPGKLTEAVKEIMKSSEEETKQKVQKKKDAEQKGVTQPSKKKLEQARKRALKTPGFRQKSRVR